ncbi:hypothetical protein BGX26_012452, partial [Mortierella sp. AD094]
MLHNSSLRNNLWPIIFQEQLWKAYVSRKGYAHNEIPDLSGKVVIVTGANTGLGYAITVALAAHGATNAIERARKEIKEKHPKSGDPRLGFLELNLNDLSVVRSGVDFDTINDETKTSSFERYSRSKLANITFAKSLTRRLEKERVYVNVAHLDYVCTDLMRYTKDVIGSLTTKISDVLGGIFARPLKSGRSSLKISRDNTLFPLIMGFFQARMLVMEIFKRSSGHSARN